MLRHYWETIWDSWLGRCAVLAVVFGAVPFYLLSRLAAGLS